jgi:GNAT superfamily N-acetyltransferase
MKSRRMTSADIPALAKLVKGDKAIEDYPGEYSPVALRSVLKEGIGYVIDDKGPVAFIVLTISRMQRRMFVDIVAVNKNYRNKGLGALLLAQAERLARKRRLKRITMLMRDWNKPMNALAKKKGYLLKDMLCYREKEL